MGDFIKKLYANENFALYLGIIIVVLIVIFFIVYFLGKIDQKKLEKTRKLEKIDPNTFKDLSTATNVQVAAPVVGQNQNVVAPVEPVKQNVNMQYPAQQATDVQQTWQGYQNQNETYDNQMQNYQQPAAPQVEYQTPVAAPVNNSGYEGYTYPQTQNIEYQMPANPVPEVHVQPTYEQPVQFETPVEPQVQNPTIAMPEEPVVSENNQTYNIDFSNLTNSIEQELNSLETMTKSVSPTVEIPKTESVSVEEDSSRLEMPMPKNTKVVTDVFSSVYAPAKETPAATADDEEIELPKLKR